MMEMMQDLKQSYWDFLCRIFLASNNREPNSKWIKQRKLSLFYIIRFKVGWFQVWVNSGSWWWTGRPGVLWFMGLQSRTRLSNWTELMVNTVNNTVLYTYNLLRKVITTHTQSVTLWGVNYVNYLDCSSLVLGNYGFSSSRSSEIFNCFFRCVSSPF